MAKGLTQFVTDIRAYLAKGKLKAARKTLEKALKAGNKGPQLEEVVFELLLAEGGGAAAAAQLRALQAKAETRLPAALKHAEVYLRRNKDDHVLRDAVWELCLDLGEGEAALRHLKHLATAGAVDGAARGRSLQQRKDVTGVIGLFLLGSLGIIKIERIKVADRLLGNARAAARLAQAAEALSSAGIDDGAVHYVLARIAQSEGDRDRFLMHAGRAFEEKPEELWTWTETQVDARDRIEIALRSESLSHLLEALGQATPGDILDVANRTSGEGSAAKALRGLGLLTNGKVLNACRILEGLVAEDAETAEPIAGLLGSKAGTWEGAAEVHAAVVGVGLGDRPQSVGSAADLLLAVPEEQRGEAWGRVAPRILDHATGHAGLREALGLYLLGAGDGEGAAALLTEPAHLAIAKRWVERGPAPGPVLLAAAGLAEEHDRIADNAEWLLRSATGDPSLLSELSKRLSGSTVSATTALASVGALLDQGQKLEAAQLLSRLPLDENTGRQVDELVSARSLRDDRDFQEVCFRTALAIGDGGRAKLLFRGVDANMQALAREAAAHPAAARVLADVLIGHDKGEVAVGLLEARRVAGDEARGLLPLADALLKSAPRLAMARLVRAKLRMQLDRGADAVRDLRAIPVKAAELDEAFELLGELLDADPKGGATLGRADIHIARGQFTQGVKELFAHPCDPGQRLERFETICKKSPELGAAHEGRARTLFELGRVPEAAEAHTQRFACVDADPAKVAGDLEEVARAALASGDLETGSAILESLPEQVSDGAERAIGVIGEDSRPQLLLLRSNMLLHLRRPGKAVETLAGLVRTDKDSRPKAAQALAALIDAGQARPEADFALTEAYDAMGRTGEALAALQRLYEDDITGKENVVQAAGKLVVRADDPDVRLFLGRICLDKRDPAGATEHAIHARRLRPAARRDCVGLLRHALDLDAFAPETHFALAEAHLAGDEADDAVRHFRAAVEVDRSRAKSAIAAMEEAAPRSKHPALLWLAVGTTDAEFLRDHTEAVGAFTKGLKANPTTELRVPLLLGRGDSFAALREDDKAFDDFDEASRHDLLERRYYEFLRARHRKRVLEAAEAARQKADVDFACAAEAVGLFTRLGRAQEAVDVAQAALARAPDALGPRYLVGVALHAAGRYDAAAQMLETVRASAGAQTAAGRAARMLLAESYLDNGERTRARACLTEIESVDAAYPGLEARRAALAPPADDPLAPPPLFVRPKFPRPSE